jgi:hypothetical protein
MGNDGGSVGSGVHKGDRAIGDALYQRGCTRFWSHAASNLNHWIGAEPKTEARMGAAVAVLARQRAVKAAKHQLHARGLKPQYMPLPQIAAAAEDYLANHRAQLVAEAKQIIERWAAEGFFGRRAKLKTNAQNAEA